eukprot:661699-Amphidinium_carterae.1
MIDPPTHPTLFVCGYGDKHKGHHARVPLTTLLEKALDVPSTCRLDCNFCTGSLCCSFCDALRSPLSIRRQALETWGWPQTLHTMRIHLANIRCNLATWIIIGHFDNDNLAAMFCCNNAAKSLRGAHSASNRAMLVPSLTLCRQ